MDKLEELKEKLKVLSAEEVKSIKEFLNQEVAMQENSTEVVDGKTNEVEEVKDEVVEEAAPTKVGETLPEEAKEESGEEIDNTKTEEELEDADTETDVDEQKESEVVKSNEEEVATQEQAAPQPTPDDIPTMKKGVEGVDEETPVAPQTLTADTGEELPIDYEQIIEAQNAKISALQAENTSLKTKVEGAFGYSAKPANSVKVNRLYDDALDVHFRK